MARTTIYRALSAGATVSISITAPRKPRAPRAPKDETAAIDWHVNQICKLAEEFIASTNGSCVVGHPQRISYHERQLARLGICRTSIYSLVNRASIPAVAP